jgi:pimeloyl-ACP methyl ester carboxylesterase
VGADAEPFAAGSSPALRGEVLGEGRHAVLCHGLTATRRYVVHGSGGLARRGFRQVTYDARGHGESEPAPAGDGYGYPQLVADLEEVVAAQVGEEAFLLAGHSMGAHTAVAYALENPDRVAGLVVIGPVYRGAVADESLEYWDGLADALEERGEEGFVDYLGGQGIDPAWRDTVLRISRERIGQHSDRGALVQALREVPRSRPFESLDELDFCEVPALVVGSRDEADPGHPLAVAEAYAQHLPEARFLSEEEGDSPLAWQGGKLSREIATFAETPPVAERFTHGGD